MEFLIEPVIFSSVVKIGPEKIAPIAIFSVRSRKLAASVCIWQKIHVRQVVDKIPHFLTIEVYDTKMMLGCKEIVWQSLSQ